jgi:hypothetical protein
MIPWGLKSWVAARDGILASSERSAVCIASVGLNLDVGLLDFFAIVIRM